MLKKRRFKKQNVVKVTFVLTPEVEVNTVHLMGDFNDWQPSQPMRRQRNGGWRVTVDLEPGEEYQFRYLLDSQKWLNDAQADKYLTNPYGEQNSVVVT